MEDKEKFERIMKQIIGQFYEESSNWRQMGSGKYQRSTNILWDLIEYADNLDPDLIDNIMLEHDEVQ